MVGNIIIDNHGGSYNSNAFTAAIICGIYGCRGFTYYGYRFISRIAGATFCAGSYQLIYICACGFASVRELVLLANTTLSFSQTKLLMVLPFTVALAVIV